MVDYRLHPAEIPWPTVILLVIVKTIHTFIINPVKWLKDSKYYRMRRLKIHFIGWPLMVIIIFTALEIACRHELHVSVIQQILLFMMEL